MSLMPMATSPVSVYTFTAGSGADVTVGDSAGVYGFLDGSYGSAVVNFILYCDQTAEYADISYMLTDSGENQLGLSFATDFAAVNAAAIVWINDNYTTFGNGTDYNITSISASDSGAVLITGTNDIVWDATDIGEQYFDLYLSS